MKYPCCSIRIQNLLVIVNPTRPIDGVMKINSALQEIKETCFNLPAAHQQEGLPPKAYPSQQPKTPKHQTYSFQFNLNFDNFFLPEPVGNFPAVELRRGKVFDCCQLKPNILQKIISVKKKNIARVRNCPDITMPMGSLMRSWVLLWGQQWSQTQGPLNCYSLCQISGSTTTMVTYRASEAAKKLICFMKNIPLYY